jgi:hypothetical protein
MPDLLWRIIRRTRLRRRRRWQIRVDYDRRIEAVWEKFYKRVYEVGEEWCIGVIAP